MTRPEEPLKTLVEKTFEYLILVYMQETAKMRVEKKDFVFLVQSRITPINFSPMEIHLPKTNVKSPFNSFLLYSCSLYSDFCISQNHSSRFPIVLESDSCFRGPTIPNEAKYNHDH